MKSGNDKRLILGDKINLLNRLGLYYEVRDVFFSLKGAALSSANEAVDKKQKEIDDKEKYKIAAERLLADILKNELKLKISENDSEKLIERKLKFKKRLEFLSEDLKNKF